MALFRLRSSFFGATPDRHPSYGPIPPEVDKRLTVSLPDGSQGRQVFQPQVDPPLVDILLNCITLITYLLLTQHFMALSSNG
jgi:hypothetical protein